LYFAVVVHDGRSMSRELRYLQISDDLRRQIREGVIAAGTLIASEADLALSYGASRVTVRRALGELKAEGLVDSRQGFGWYAVAAPLVQDLRDLTAIERQIRAHGREFRRELTAFEFVPTPPELAGLFDAATVLAITRIDRIDSRPFSVASVWAVADLVASLTAQDLEARPLSEQLGVPLSGATESITAVGASSPDAQVLGVRRSTPLLQVDRVIRDQAGRAVLRSQARYHPLLTEFGVELPPAGAREDAAVAVRPAPASP
jgi:GntR family transcriptional regulator